MQVISFLNESHLSCLHTGTVIVFTQLNSFNYCYLSLIILFNIDHLFADSEVVTSIAIKHLKFYSTFLIRLHAVKWFLVLLYIINNSIKRQPFVYSQLKDQPLRFLTIQFSISYFFTLCLNVKQFYEPLIVSYQVLPLRLDWT